jgi:hypothetical protein
MPLYKAELTPKPTRFALHIEAKSREDALAIAGWWWDEQLFNDPEANAAQVELTDTTHPRAVRIQAVYEDDTLSHYRVNP